MAPLQPSTTADAPRTWHQRESRIQADGCSVEIRGRTAVRIPHARSDLLANVTQSQGEHPTEQRSLEPSHHRVESRNPAQYYTNRLSKEIPRRSRRLRGGSKESVSCREADPRSDPGSRRAYPMGWRGACARNRARLVSLAESICNTSPVFTLFGCIDVSHL